MMLQVLQRKCEGK